MIAGLPKAPWTSPGRTAPLTSSTAAPAKATTSERTRSQISMATTTANTASVTFWSKLMAG